MNKYLSISIICVLSLTFIKCSSHNVALEDARKSYQNASNDPTVVKNAPVALHDANEALKNAEQAKKDGKKEPDVTHLANLAKTRVDIARVEAQRNVQETTFKDVSQSRSDAVIAAREAETDELRKSSATLRQSNQDLEDSATRDQAAAASLQERNKELENELAKLKMKPTARGMELTLHDTVFEFGKSDLKAGTVRDLQKISQELSKTPDVKILVEGHTDSIGSDEFNKGLSQRRADAVQNALQTNLNNSQITSRGLGKQYPIASNATEAGRQQNRRVTIIVLSADGTNQQSTRD